MNQRIFDKYATQVAEAYGLTMAQMFEKTKQRAVVDARQLLFYLCRIRPMRPVYIQRHLEAAGYFTSHSAILHGISQAKKRIEKERDLADIAKVLHDQALRFELEDS
jgi:chromosomal replication initiation ATPase DnaA